ncbi:MAG TPA: diaminopimelate epimerase, partial [Verrucomicrobiales bacterium]|nr:diaminopimelate epimerase [Verrucomicrobiales bacterium]
MHIQFTKMNGAGNDFVLIDNRDGHVVLSREQIARVCHRQRGVGADGLMLLKNAEGEGDWAWDFFNADGSDAEMCGNGARCFASYIQHTIGGEGTLSFETVCGLIRAEVGDTDVTVNLTAPQGLALNETISTSDGDKTVHSL